jgi:hypothetical protein
MISVLLSLGALAALGKAQYTPAPYIQGVFSNSTGASLNILTKSGVRNATSDMLRGIMWEDISVSVDSTAFTAI